jgi:hypothetical protein
MHGETTLARAKISAEKTRRDTTGVQKATVFN